MYYAFFWLRYIRASFFIFIFSLVTCGMRPFSKRRIFMVLKADSVLNLKLNWQALFYKKLEKRCSHRYTVLWRINIFFKFVKNAVWYRIPVFSVVKQGWSLFFKAGFGSFGSAQKRRNPLCLQGVSFQRRKRLQCLYNNPRKYRDFDILFKNRVTNRVT